MSFFSFAWNWLKQPQQWHGSEGIPVRILEQLYYTGLALLIAALIAIPLGILIGHTGRGAVLVVTCQRLAGHPHPRPAGPAGHLARVLRPGLAGSAGRARDSAHPGQRLRGNSRGGPRAQGRRPGHGDDPLAAGAEGRGPGGHPLIVLGLRTGAIFVVATATIAAYIGLGGLGRYIIDGLAVSNYGEVTAGHFFASWPSPSKRFLSGSGG